MILTAMILAAPIICAQSMSLYECIYQYDINGKTAKGDLSETYCCMLQIGEENSRFIDYAAFQLDSVSAITGTYKLLRIRCHADCERSDRS